MIEVDGLTKHFGTIKALDGLSFTVKPGRVTGFLGPNGAGKTTTLRCALGLVQPTAGRVCFDGLEYRQIKHPARRIGAALEATTFHPGRSARNHLRSLAPFVGVPDQRCDETLELVGLATVAHQPVGQFSLGMRGRLGLAAALLGDPATLLLDEPVNGLDPEGIAWIRRLLRQLADEGRTILVSSHLLSEVQQTVDDVIIIAQGRLVKAGQLSELDNDGGHLTYVVAADPAGFGDLARKHSWAFTTQADGVLVEGPDATMIGQTAAAAGLTLHQLATRARGLEATFLQLTEQTAPFSATTKRSRRHRNSSR